MTIALFFLAHWQISVFLQSFFLHRYGAHAQFEMSHRWERFFHFLTWLAQGPNYLNPRVYAILHRMHHAYSDTVKDPHSPVVEPNLVRMMLKTEQTYHALKDGSMPIEPRFEGGTPGWPLVDQTLGGLPRRVGFIALYVAFYLKFATAAWMWLLLPVQIWMGPIHGAIVNYFGHRLGYRNFANDDDSRNTLPWDVLTMGELFQNNHHRFSGRANFAYKAFEIDPGYQIMRVLAWLGIIRMKAQPAP